MSNLPFPGPAVVVSQIGEQLAQGPAGPQGLQGPPGPAGLGTLQAYGADLFGSAATLQWVASISGQGGSGITVPVHAAGLQFDAVQTAPTISQVAAATPTTAPVSMFWAPQPPNAGASGATYGTPGSLLISLAAPVGGGKNAGLVVREGGTTFFRLDNGTSQGTGNPGIWFGPNAAAPTASNVSVIYEPAAGISLLGGSSTGEVYLQAGLLGAQTATIALDPVFGVNIYSENVVANPNPPASIHIKDAYFDYEVIDASTEYKMIEAGLTSGHLFTSLNNGTGNSTSLTTNQGNGVTFVWNAIVAPTAGKTGGFFLYSTAGNPWITTSAGVSFQILPATAAFVPDKDLNGVGTSTTTAQYVSSLSFDSTGFVHGPVSPIPVNGTGAGLNWIDGAVALQHVGTTLLQLAATTTDFLSFGAPAATSGFIRTPNNSIIISAWSSGHSANMNLMSTDSSDNLTLGTGLFGGIRLANSTGTTARLDAGSSDFLKLGASAATFGYVRTPAAAASTGIVTAGTEYVLAWGAGSELAIGHFVNPTATMVLYFGGLIQFNDGAASTVAEFTSTTVAFLQPVDFDWVGNTSASASAGGSGALPAQVAGYLNLQVSGVTRKFPFYVI